MDNNQLIQLAKDTTILLTPVLPYLYKAGEEASKEAGKRFGIAVWEKAKKIWESLNYNIELRPQLIDAAKDVIENPQDEDAKASLRLKLKKMFKEDNELVHNIEDLLKDEIVQRVISEQSEVKNIDQEINGNGNIVQEIIAKDHSKIEGVRQRKQ